MNYSEVEKQLIFGHNLVDLRLLLIAHEMKGYPYPTAEVEQIRLTFVRQYDVSPDSVPTSLKGSDIPDWFLSEIAQEKNQITALLVSLGYNVSWWWRMKFHGGQILLEMQRNNTRIIEDLNYELPGIRDKIINILAYYQEIEFDPEKTQDLYDQIIRAVTEYLPQSGQAQKSSPGGRSSKPNNIFISYSHRDRKWLERLQVHLRPLERIGMIAPWADTSLQAGTQWREEIKNAIASAKAAVLLISADFLSSEFISTDELPPLLIAAESQGTIILSIIIGPCLFQETKSLSRFQSVNPPHRPLSRITKNEQEEIFVKVAKTIKSIFDS